MCSSLCLWLFLWLFTGLPVARPSDHRAGVLFLEMAPLTTPPKVVSVFPATLLCALVYFHLVYITSWKYILDNFHLLYIVYLPPLSCFLLNLQCLVLFLTM